MSASNAASANGSDSARPSRSSIRAAEAGALDARPAGGEHLRALVDADDVRSGAARASSIATAAVPVATSSTRVAPAGTRETRNARQRGSWPNESSRAYRSYVGPSGANSSRASLRPRRKLGHGAESILGVMALERRPRADRSRRGALAAPGEQVTGVLAAEPRGAGRVYLCALESGRPGRRGSRSTATASPSASRRLVREAASLAALCELAEELAGGGDLDELRARLAELRADRGAGGDRGGRGGGGARSSRRSSRSRGSRPPAYLDALGVAARRLERALGDDAGSPFAAALQQALPRDRGARGRGRGAVQAALCLNSAATLEPWKAADFGFPFGGDPEDLMRGLREFAEQQAERCRRRSASSSRR